MSTTITNPAGGKTREGSTTILMVVLAAQAMAVIDLTIVNVAAPTIRADLHTSGAGLQMVVAGYVITYAMSLITGARLGDRLGHAAVFRAGLAIFTLSSLACGLAQNPTELVAFRLAQGLGAGAMMPQVMSLIQRTFPGPARAKALGYYSAVIALGAVVGQVAGGALVSADIAGSGWRPVFLVNVPIGAALIVLAGRHLPRGGGQAHRRLDPLGVVTSSAGVLALVVPLVLGHQEGWPAWCWASMAAAVVLFAAFVFVERRVAAGGGSPLVSGRVLRAPGLVAGAGTIFLAMLGFSGFLFVFTLHLQSTLRLSALHTGLTFVPAAAGSAIASLNWSRLPAPWHRRLVPLGMTGAAVGYALLFPIEHGGRLNTGWLVADLFAIGLLFGLSYSPVITLALSRVPLADAADASGVLITMLQLGQVVGIATLGTLYLSLAASGPAVPAATTSFAAAAASTAVAAIAGAFMVRRRSPRPIDIDPAAESPAAKTSISDARR
jgi:MFS family permease